MYVYKVLYLHIACTFTFQYCIFHCAVIVYKVIFLMWRESMVKSEIGLVKGRLNFQCIYLDISLIMLVILCNIFRVYRIEQNFGEFGKSPQFAKFFRQHSRGHAVCVSRERTTREARHLKLLYKMMR